MNADIRALSFGAGVQSTCLLMLSLRGDLPPLDAVIFADTGYEPREVYEHLARCERLCLDAGVPFYKTHYRNIRDDIVEAADRQARGERGGMRATYQIPLFSRPAGERVDKVGMMARFCTSNYKTHGVDKQINQLRREWRLARGMAARARRGEPPTVEVLLGISLDEIERMKADPTHRPWMRYRHPLAWDMRWSRKDCLRWFDSLDMPRPPRSACVCCPYKSNREWRHMRDSDPEAWEDACELDDYIRDRTNDGSTVYLHRSGEPLRSAQLEDERLGLLGWLEECSGTCGI